MQQPPTAAELLATVMEVLSDEVVPALSGPVQHNARVAANLVAIVERELRLGGDAATREHAAIAALLDGVDDGVGDGSANSDLDLAALRDKLAAALRRGMADDEATNERVWSTLMAVVRVDLTIAKPGHDAWDGD
ncbi:MAG TPA: DUF6285 domain-containing protein [Ilumatobacter sp.]